MGSFLNQPVLQPVDSSQREFRLLSEFVFYIDEAEELPDELPAVNYALYKNYPALIVPRGYITDMASIPRLLWALYSPFGRYGNAAILHDFLYSSEMFSRPVCDGLFRYAMAVSGVNIIRRNIMYWAVRRFGGFVWLNHSPIEVKALRMIAEDTNSEYGGNDNLPLAS
jgi:hypothetical protein